MGDASGRSQFIGRLSHDPVAASFVVRGRPTEFCALPAVLDRSVFVSTDRPPHKYVTACQPEARPAVRDCECRYQAWPVRGDLPRGCCC